ncbi:MAG: nitronate monooxygenase [Bacteroidetes bacterium]|nr:nitronate monooxygenase [Bacteroidota bacterium]
MNRIIQLFQIQYPIIQAGMIWCSGWKLASAVSNAGGLGLIGAGSMHPEVLEEHIRKCRQATDKPFGVNLPLIYPEVDKLIQLIISHGVKIVFTSAGNPAKYTSMLHDHGIRVAHVVANTKSAVKCEQAGVDAIVAEGFEAGGHNGKEETTTMVLIPMVREVTGLPLIAAGGIGSGRAMLAAMALGAEGVQIGSLFAAAEESSAHPEFKKKIIETMDGDTFLSLKKVMPVRLIRNNFFQNIHELEERGAGEDELKEILGRGRAKLGMFEGDLEEGELEIGQVSAMIREIKPASTIIRELITDYNNALSSLYPIS